MDIHRSFKESDYISAFNIDFLNGFSPIYDVDEEEEIFVIGLNGIQTKINYKKSNIKTPLLSTKLFDPEKVIKQFLLDSIHYSQKLHLRSIKMKDVLGNRGEGRIFHNSSNKSFLDMPKTHILSGMDNDLIAFLPKEEFFGVFSYCEKDGHVLFGAFCSPQLIKVCYLKA